MRNAMLDHEYWRCKKEKMEIVKFICTDKSLRNCTSNCVTEFDSYENYDMINEFFGGHDKSLMCSKEEYFDGFDRNAWTDYVIIENGKIISRAGIWKAKDNEWEVAGVSTLPAYRRKDYGKTVVRHCIAKIIESGRTATCSTKATNIPMIKTAIKAGFKLVE